MESIVPDLLRSLGIDNNLTPTELSVLKHVAQYPNSTMYQMRLKNNIPVKPALLRPILDTLVNAGLLTSKETKKKNREGNPVLLYSPTFHGVIKCFVAIRLEFPREYTDEDIEALLDYVENTIKRNSELFPASNILLKDTSEKGRPVILLRLIGPEFIEGVTERALLAGMAGVIPDSLIKLDKDFANEIIDTRLEELKREITRLEKAKNNLVS